MALRRGVDRGAVSVEAALITPILILLVFGVIEFGLALKDWLAVTSAVRAGARIAAAEPRATSYADDAAASVSREAVNLDPTTIQELWIYKAASDGTPVGDSGYFASCSSCVKYAWDTTSKSFVRAAGSPDWPATSQNAWESVNVPIPAGYTCDDLDLTKCWLKLRIYYGSGSDTRDTTSWQAQMDGDPVRLVE